MVATTTAVGTVVLTGGAAAPVIAHVVVAMARFGTAIAAADTAATAADPAAGTVLGGSIGGGMVSTVTAMAFLTLPPIWVLSAGLCSAQTKCNTAKRVA